MLYYTDEARKSALDNIAECISAVNSIPWDRLPYGTACQIVKHLADLRKVIKAESSAGCGSVAEMMRSIGENNRNDDEVVGNILNKIERLAECGDTSAYFDKGRSFATEGLDEANYESIKRKLSAMGFSFGSDNFMSLAGYITHTTIVWG